MGDFGEVMQPVARKAHRCGWCGGGIHPGDKHNHFKGNWHGDWQNWRMHFECYEEYQSQGYDQFTLYDNERPALAATPDAPDA